MEKFTPHYILDDIKKAFSSVSTLRMTRTARLSSTALGIRDDDVILIVQSLTRSNFYKAMTTYADYKVWQDIYHAKFNEIELYIKFQKLPEGYFLIVSLKEK